MSRRIVSAALIALAACSPELGSEQEEAAAVQGRVAGYVATGDVIQLENVRVTARLSHDSTVLGGTVDDAGTVIAETVTNPDGTYSIEVPPQWVALTFEYEGYERTVRVEDFGYEAVRSGLDVHLLIEPESFPFAMPQVGEPPVLLDFDSPAGRGYAHLRIEPGDLWTEDGSPVVGTVTARIAAPHPTDTHKDAFPQSAYLADAALGIVPLHTLGFIDVELTQDGQPLRVAGGQTVTWESEIPAESVQQVEDAFATGSLVRSHILDRASGMWIIDGTQVELDGGRLSVERSALGEALIGYPAAVGEFQPSEGEGEGEGFRAASPTYCPDPGRSAVVILTMSNPRTPRIVAENVIRTSVAYVAQASAPRILVVLDDDHHDEFTADAQYIVDVLRAAGYPVTLINEPSSGLRSQDVSGYDVVWFTNPGWPVDDALSLQTLGAFREAGGGFVLSGDDITMNPTNSTTVRMSDYTFLNHADNGTTTCGRPTDNNAGDSYRITFDHTDHLLAAGLDGTTFLYGDDIDHSTPVNDGETVLAWANLEGYPSCTVRTPVVIAVDTDNSRRRAECACTSDNDCLGAQHCTGGECVSCSVSGYSCTSDDECCGGLSCNSGTCGDACQAEGESCEAGGDCCGSMSCVSGQCSTCAPSGAACDVDGDCCGGLLCVDGTCDPCRVEIEHCGESMDCCRGSEVIDCVETTERETVATQSCAGSRVLTATVRDFQVAHADFEYRIGSETGIVHETLGTNGKPVYAGNPTTYTTNGSQLFNQWFNDVSGVNRSSQLTLTLEEVSPGVYQYKNNAFFPIDGQGFGNEGNGHNYHFTLELHTTFVYRGGEQFTFTGDDDLFTFINKKLAIDLGGVHSKLSRTVDLDAEAAGLGLTIGQTYPLDIFFAERHTTESNFRIDTTIGCLAQTQVLDVTAPRCVVIETDPNGTCGVDGEVGVIGLTEAKVSGAGWVADGAAEGGVFSNGSIKLSGTAKVEGSAITSAGAGSIRLDGHPILLGQQVTNADSIRTVDLRDTFDRVAIENKNAQIPNVPWTNGRTRSPLRSGKLSLDSYESIALVAGDYSVNEISIAGQSTMTCQGTVNIYVRGKVSIAGDSRVNANAGCDLRIFSNSTEGFGISGGSIVGAYIYAPSATVKLAGTAHLVGSMLGKVADVSGTSRVTSKGALLETLGFCTRMPEEEVEDPNDLPDELPDLPDHPA